jgi:DNA-binding transcriptional MocR family regulator
MQVTAQILEPFLYERIAGKISDLIEKGTLRPGEKVPSVRRMSNQEQVSISTILQAYFLLEDRGLIEARPQSGFYVRLKPRALPPEPATSHPPALASRVNISELIANIHDAVLDPEMVPLGGAVPGEEMLPVRKLNRILASLSRNADITTHLYAPVQGTPELRHQIARRSIDQGCSLTGDDIVTTFGCTEAVNLCLRAVASQGDTIAVESPTYYGFLQIIESLKMKALEIPTSPKSGICLDALEAALRKHPVKACLVTPNFHNPLGALMPDHKKKNLVELLSRKNVPLIEDDIYGELHFDGERPKVCKAFDRNDNVLLCASYSKSISPSLRVGWTAPGKYLQQVKQLKLTNTLSPVTLSQLAVAEILKSGGYDHHLRRIRRAYSSLVQIFAQAIGQYFPEGTKVTRPEGGYVLWVELPSSVDSMELYRKAREQKISIAPGSMFSAKQHYRNCIRLNCSHLWSDRLNDAIFTLGRLTSELMRK